MALDPEELVALANHGIMKLRSAVARGTMLPPEERDAAAIIVRKGASLAQSTLDFEQIKQLAARWRQEQPAPSSQTTPCHR